MLKLFADLKATAKLSLDLDLVGASRSFARGNEDNQHQADSTYYLGPGAAPGYAIVNLGARYLLNRWLQVIGQINNLFDRHYYTTAQLGPPASPMRARSSPVHFRTSTASSRCSNRLSTPGAPQLLVRHTIQFDTSPARNDQSERLPTKNVIANWGQLN
jgi:hypothetical protein